MNDVNLIEQAMTDDVTEAIAEAFEPFALLPRLVQGELEEWLDPRTIDDAILETWRSER